MRRDASHRRNHCSAARGLVAGLLAAACLLVGCSGVTQTPFQHRACEAAGTLAAAPETLSAVQEGRLTEGYARASFAYDQLNVLQLPSQALGDPDLR